MRKQSAESLYLEAKRVIEFQLTVDISNYHGEKLLGVSDILDKVHGYIRGQKDCAKYFRPLAERFTLLGKLLLARAITTNNNSRKKFLSTSIKSLLNSCAYYEDRDEFLLASKAYFQLAHCYYFRCTTDFSKEDDLKMAKNYVDEGLMIYKSLGKNSLCKLMYTLELSYCGSDERKEELKGLVAKADNRGDSSQEEVIRTGKKLVELAARLEQKLDRLNLSEQADLLNLRLNYLTSAQIIFHTHRCKEELEICLVQFVDVCLDLVNVELCSRYLLFFVHGFSLYMEVT